MKERARGVIIRGRVLEALAETSETEDRPIYDIINWKNSRRGLGQSRPLIG